MNKKMGIAMILTVCALAVSITSFASNDNKDYAFRIGAYQINGRVDEPEYRQTKYPENPWKVKMTNSEEGSRTVAQYWLENAAESNVSPTISVTEGLGPYYEDAYNTASQTNVYLTAQNNNINVKSYDVEGIWDEETWD